LASRIQNTNHVVVCPECASGRIQCGEAARSARTFQTCNGDMTAEARNAVSSVYNSMVQMGGVNHRL